MQENQYKLQRSDMLQKKLFIQISEYLQSIQWPRARVADIIRELTVLIPSLLRCFKCPNKYPKLKQDYRECFYRQLLYSIVAVWFLMKYMYASLYSTLI